MEQASDISSVTPPTPGDTSSGVSTEPSVPPLISSDLSISTATTSISSNVSLATDGLAGLEVNGRKRRHGIYGIESLRTQLLPTRPSSDTHLQTQSYQPSILQQGLGLSESSRPSKISRTVIRTRPSLLALQDSLESGSSVADEQFSPTQRSHGTISDSRPDPPSEESRELTRGPSLEPPHSQQTFQRQTSSNIQVEHDAKTHLCDSQISRLSMCSATPDELQPEHSPTNDDAASSRKRKHTEFMDDTLSRPPFIWQGATEPNFTAFQGLLLFPELCFVLATHLPLRDLISLYSISRDFHAIISTRLTTCCLAVARKRAPESARIFQFRMYANLCQPDLSNRIPHPNPIKAASYELRKVPSFKWVAFVLFREKVVHEMMAVFAENGVPLPAPCQRAIKLMWLIMDIPDNARRIGFIHNRKNVADLDIYFMFCFLVKLDMMCHDPLAAEKHDGLRKLMLSQRNGMLSVLLVLKRVQWKTNADLLIAWIRHACEIDAVQDSDDFDAIAFGAETIFGVPIEEAGLGKYEYWGQHGAFKRREAGLEPSSSIRADTSTTTQTQKQRYGILMRPDQLVMREAVRRRLQLGKVSLKTILSGYLDNLTLSSRPPSLHPRRIPEWNNEEYSANDLVGGAPAIAPDQGGDPLLDLGKPHGKYAAPLVVRHARDDGHDDSHRSDIVARRVRTMREDQDAFLDLCVRFFAIESAKINETDPITQDEVVPLP